MEVNDSLNHKWAILLGASGEVGRATALKMAKQGVNLCLVYRERKSSLKELNAHHNALQETGVEILQYNLDALKQENRESIIHDLAAKGQSQVCLLVHAIAKGTLKSLTGDNRASAQDYEITQYAMAFSLVDWVNSCLDHNLFCENASVISIDSDGSQQYIPNYGVVGATKAALIKLTQDLAVELAPKQIQCNVIRAGVMDSNALNMLEDSELIKQKAKEASCNGQLITGADVAKAIYQFCLPESNKITGTILIVNGEGENGRS